MTGTLVFNHHSLPFDHRSSADIAVPVFLKICIEAKNAGLTTILVDESTDANWFRQELSPGYFFQDWYNKYKDGYQGDVVRVFRAIATQQPFFNARDIENGSELFNVSLVGSSYTALTAAAWHIAPIVSFETRDPWLTTPLAVDVEKIDLDTEDLVEDQVKILNYYNYTVFSESLTRILAERDAQLSSGREVVSQAEKLYPFLILCGKSKQQLSNWSAGMTIFKQVKRSLVELNSFSERWQSGQFDFYSADNLRKSGLPFKVSGESESVRNNPVLKKERMFWLPLGVERYFGEHIKLTNGYRLHFYPNNADKKIYVGYIGPHLRLP